ncbi:RNA polymerase subunit sigma-24 [Aeromicrobium sp. Root236]|uniref:RNA polymerase sigma factor n=1 Tax=Aeromicrobium sp. Root236 TaxID=1736498 RepID=UPI0006FEA8D4|nr:RNA polymerase sigma factor [Aeromicrobium sp. Root236]KRC65881.1 RNA polymerase subunit sigma-24 [Aeromicrobium sp. Root236]
MDVDEQLIARARAGEAPAMEELLAAIRPRVVSRCARLLPHTLDAEEAAQDALLSIATHLKDYSGEGSFMGWVTVIASNSARQTYRTLKRRFAERSVDELPVSPDPRTTSVIAGSRLDLLDAIEALEQAHPATAEAFVLRDIGALPYDEIAALTQTPLGTVKARIHTARGFVRERLGVNEGNF